MSVTSSPPTTQRPGGRPVSARVEGRRRLVAALVALLLVVVVLEIALGGDSAATPANGAASIVPADALAYVNLSLDPSRPAAKQALATGARVPYLSVARGVAVARLGAILSGGRAVDFTNQISPWLGGEAALALLNTPTSTAGSLIVLDVSDLVRAQTFVHSSGAVARGSYRSTPLLVYASGSELAFVGHYLVLGQDASVRAAIDVAAGAAPSLAADSTYQRASATEAPGRLIDVYASLAGVRRLLTAQGGVLGALGGLLYQPALQGVAISLTPTAGGARIQIHSALDPTLARLSVPATAAFTPSLQDVIPTGSTLMLDVNGLDRVAPQVLNAGAAAGFVGAIGPLLSRLGTALRAEGVNVANVISIFGHEAAVAIVPHGQSPTLVIVARTADQAQAQTQLAELQAPLAQLFASSRKPAGTAPAFTDRQVGGITAHQLALTAGLELDYAVSRGLVVISTNLAGIAAVLQQSHPLAQDPAFRSTLSDRPKLVTSLVFANLRQVLSLGGQTGLTGSATFKALLPALERIGGVGLSSTRGKSDSTTQLSVQIP